VTALTPGVVVVHLRKDKFMLDMMYIGLAIFFGLISWAFIVLCSKA